MDIQETKEKKVILADDVTQIGIKIIPQQKSYIRFYKSPKSMSKKGSEYSSPTRNSEGYCNPEDFQKVQEEEELQRTHQTRKTRSNLVPQKKKEESPQTRGMSQQQKNF